MGSLTKRRPGHPVANMNVRLKTVATIALTLIGLLLILYAAYLNIVAQNVAELEIESTTGDVDRVLVAFNDDISRLNITVGDWAPWDDTYQFVVDGNTEYIESNLSASTLINLQLNIMAFVNNEGQLVYGTDLDVLTGSETALPNGMASHIQAGAPLLTYEQPTDNVTGLLMIDGRPLLVAALPISTSEQSGPIHGALVMGRWLNTDVVDELAQRTQLSINVFPYASPSLPDDVAAAKAALLANTTIHIAVLDEEIVGGYTLVDDIYGQPGIIVRVESPRTAYTQAKTSQSYFLVALLVAGLVFGAVTYISIERVVLSRLARLDQNVRHIGNAGNLAARVTVNGRDEISTLAASVNLMLDSLERSRSQEHESQERYRAVVEQTSDGIILCDAGTRQLLEVNPAFMGLMGFQPDRILNLTLDDVLVIEPDDANGFLDGVVSMRQSYLGERLCRRADGSEVWVEVSANLIMLSKPVVCLVLRDITERRQAEHVRTMSERRFRALVEHSAEAITLFDAQGHVLYDSPAAPGMLGYGPEELVGTNAFSHIHPDDVSEVARQVERVQRDPAAQLNCIFRFQHKSGAWRWLEASGRNLFAEPSVQAIVVNYRDITGRVTSGQEIQQHAERAESLARVAARLNAQLDLQRVLQAVCEESALALKMPATGLNLFDESLQTLARASTYGLPPEFDLCPERFWQSEIQSQGRIEGSALFIRDVQALVNLPHADSYAALEIRSFVSTPLNRDGTIIGYLSAAALGDPRDFVLEELDLLQSLADLAAQAIVNARLYEDNISQLERLMALNVTARRLTQTYDFNELAVEVVRACIDGFGIDLAWLGQLGLNGQMITLAVQGRAQTSLDNTRMVWNELMQPAGGNDQSVKAAFPIAIADLTAEPHPASWQKAALAQGFRSALALPLIARDDPFGALLLLDRRPGVFTADQMQFLVIYANQVATALENTRLYSETARRLQSVKTLRAIDSAIISSTDLQFTLTTILAEITSQLNIDAADILLFNSSTQMLEYSASRGFRTDALRYTRLRIGQGNAGRAALSRKIILVPDPGNPGGELTRSPLLSQEDFQAYYGVPLISRGQIKGVLEIFLRHTPHYDSEWMELLDALAGQIAIAIDNAALLDGLQRANTELVVAYNATIEGWSRALDMRDRETEGHTQRVTQMTLRLARVMGVTDTEQVHVWRGALLHDIGKMAIPDSILLKPGPLTTEEWAIMRQHPQHANAMLAPIAYLQPALDIPNYHHEKWDGTGYPKGLKGEQIPLVARIFAVVDVWDALSFDRPYRGAWPAEKVKTYIHDQSGKHFDPRVVGLFLTLLETTE
jgi:PAS domain S-box-containing protein